MKAMWTAISILCVAHMLALVGTLGYLAGTGRLSRPRVEAVRDVFVMTVADQQAQEEQAAEEARTLAEEQARLARLDDANLGVEHRINRLQKQEELLRGKLTRAEADRKQLELALEQRLRDLEQASAQLQEERDLFRKELDRQAKLRSDEQFQKTISILKGLPSEQLKAELDVYMARDETEWVVDIIDALDKRTAQKLFEEYESPADLEVAADLLVRLKERGSLNLPDLKAGT
ncbi:MAG: hypothetical protein D8M59_12295 [Planctomycetes bacterium]|nr:hypothetical protein [Planctomycetota bacterium]NOG53589.1 hypothetical protein [Planctomycetota bacterium]